MLFEVVCQQKRFTCKWKMWFRHVFDPRLRVLVKEIVTVTLFSVYIVLCSFSIDVLWVSQGLRRKKESKGRRKREKEGGVEEGTWTICILNSCIHIRTIYIYTHTHIYSTYLYIYIVHISTIYMCVCVYIYIYIYDGIDLTRLPSRWGCFSPAPSFFSPHTIPPPLSHMYMSKAKAFFEKMSQTLNYFTSVWNVLRVSPFSSFPAFGLLVLTEK